MANIRKTFNFRNGVQVDEDNFIVNPNGLVGIGTSIPSEYLDVRGTAKIVGLATVNDLHVSGVATVTTIKVGTAISISGSGIAASKFYGDGATLSNLPTSQWLDVDVGLGFTSIHAVGNVGVGTTDPRDSFQVGGHPSMAGKLGVGINTLGNIHASGIVTANQFKGDIVGAVQGNVTGNVTGAVTGNVTGNVIGDIVGNVTASSLNATGISTLGVTTMSAGSDFHFGNHANFKDEKFLFMGDDDVFVIGHHAGPGHSQIKHDSAVQDLVLAADRVRIINRAENKGLASFTEGGNVSLKFDGNEKLSTSSTGVIITGIITATSVNVGTGGTALTVLNTGKVGIGTDIPGADLQIRKVGNTSLELIGESGQSKVSIGQSASGGDESALIRYGNPDGSLNIINYNAGSVNTYIHSGGGTGIQTGRFSWLYGQNNTEILSLTHTGRLGVGKTNPDYDLHVVGTSTITSNLGVGGNLAVDGNVTLTGTIALPDIVHGTNLHVTSGISTINKLSIGGTTLLGSGGHVYGQQSHAYFNKIGIQTTVFDVNFNSRFVGRSRFDHIGIGTTASPSDFFTGGTGISDGLHIADTAVGIDSTSVYLGGSNVGMSPSCTVGIGTNTAACILDMRHAGSLAGSPASQGRFMIPPVCNTSEIAALTAVAGGIVYNSQTNKLQLYNGTAWVNLN